MRMIAGAQASTIKKRLVSAFFFAAFAGCAALLPAQTSSAGPLVLQLDSAKSGADIDLTDPLHSVHGSFALKRGNLQFDPASGKVTGEIVFDATSGNTGNGSRDHKMHKDVLESSRYTDIVFRPDHAQGTLLTSGASTMQVHGMFGIHGAEHEMTIPVEMNITGSTWTANASFQVPYVQWGMKNPSLLFLRVGSTVAVRMHTSGTLAH